MILLADGNISLKRLGGSGDLLVLELNIKNYGNDNKRNSSRCFAKNDAAWKKAHAEQAKDKIPEVTEKNPQGFIEEKIEAKKEATSLAIIKAVGLILFLVALIYGGIWVGLGVGLLNFVVIVLLESFYYDSSEFVRSHLREDLFKILFVLLGIATLIILVVLFSKSLFQGFIALIAVIVLLLMLNKE